MARYFFHVINSEFIPDSTGLDCSTEDDAKDHAVRIAGEMLKDQGLKLWNTGHYDMFVCDEKNRTRLKLSFTAEAFSNTAGAPSKD
jgi:hypothetical protein